MSSRGLLRSILTWMVGPVMALALGCPRAYAYCRTSTVKPTATDPCPTSGKPLYWARQCISFSMTDRGRPSPPLAAVRDVADRSFRTWTNTHCPSGRLPVQVAQTEALGECTAPEYNKLGPNANTVMFVSDWSGRDLPTDAFGLTQVSYNRYTGEIYDADMQINESLGTASICEGSCPPGAFDLQNVITHEAGHFLGLGHSNVTEATMSPRATMGETSKRDLARDDIDGVCAIYGTLKPATCTTQDFLPNRGFTPICSPPDTVHATTTHCALSAVGARQGSRGEVGLFVLLGLLLMRRGSGHRRRRAAP